MNLREIRIAKGLGIDKVVAELKIRKIYIQAIEDGTYISVLPLVYAKGYVRKYARYLQVDEDQAITTYFDSENQHQTNNQDQTNNQPIQEDTHNNNHSEHLENYSQNVNPKDCTSSSWFKLKKIYWSNLQHLRTLMRRRQIKLRYPLLGIIILICGHLVYKKVGKTKHHIEPETVFGQKWDNDSKVVTDDEVIEPIDKDDKATVDAHQNCKHHKHDHHKAPNKAYNSAVQVTKIPIDQNYDEGIDSIRSDQSCIPNSFESKLSPHTIIDNDQQDD